MSEELDPIAAHFRAAVDEAIKPLREEIEENDEWAHGVFLLLLEVLPHLLRNDPSAGAKVVSALERADHIYERLLSGEEIPDDFGQPLPAARYEARAKMGRALKLLKAVPPHQPE